MTSSLRRYLPNLLLLAISTGAALFGFEAVLRWQKAPDLATLQSLRRAAAEARGLAFDPRSTLEVLDAYRADGVRAFPPVKPFDFRSRSLEVAGREVVPLAGVAEVLTVFNVNETGERFVYRSDEFGFHNPPGLHQVDGVDIAVIGDSFAQGVAVRSGDGLSEQIRRRRPRTLNLGMGASGPVAELAILQEYARPLRPKLVLWLYYEANDLDDAVPEARNPILYGYLTEERRPVLRELAEPLDAALVAFTETLIENHRRSQEADASASAPVRRRALLPETRRRLSALLGTRGADGGHARRTAGGEDGFDLLRRSLLRARESVRGWGGELVVVYLPEYGRFSRRWRVRPASERREDVLGWLARENVPVIDLLPTFRAHEDPRSLFPFSLPGHYNAEGCRMVADAIVSALAQRGLLPAPTAAP